MLRSKFLNYIFIRAQGGRIFLSRVPVEERADARGVNKARVFNWANSGREEEGSELLIATRVSQALREFNLRNGNTEGDDKWRVLPPPLEINASANLLVKWI